MKTRILLFVLFILALALGGYYLLGRNNDSLANSSVEDLAEENQRSQQSGEQSSGFDKKKYSTSSPSSLWIIANKQHALPADYVPADLIVPDVRLRLSASEQQMKIRRVVQTDLEAMFAAAAKDGVTLVFGSGFRSYALQKQFYDSYVARDGQAAADRFSARPGTSEHQTGLAFDATSPAQTCHLESCFENTPQGKWLASRAHKYGFHLRYQDGKESVTGYQYEPWHFRYVGRELSAELQKTGQTLEEFFGL